MQNMKSWLIHINRDIWIVRAIQLSVILFILGLDKPANISFGIIIGFWLLDKNLWEKIKSAFQEKYVLLFISYFIITILSLIYSNDISQGLKIVETRLLLFFMPIVISTTHISPKEFNNLLLTFVITCSVASAWGLINSFLLFLETGDSGYFYNDNLVLPIGFQAAYFAIYINICIIFSIYLFVQQKSWWFIALVIFLSVIELLLATRISILSLIILALIYIGYLAVKRSWKIALSVFAILFLIIAVSIYSMPQLVNRFESLTSKIEYTYDNPNPVNHFNAEVNPENWNGLNLRMALWNCGLEIIKEHPLIGVGAGDYENEMDKKFVEKNFIYAIERHFGVHNQYLYTWISFGIIGLLIFLFTIAVPLLNALRKGNYLFIMIMLLFLLVFITENVLNRLMGVYLFAMISSMTFFKPDGDEF